LTFIGITLEATNNFTLIVLLFKYITIPGIALESVALILTIAYQIFYIENFKRIEKQVG